MNRRLGETGPVRLSVIVPGCNTDRRLWVRVVDSIIKATCPSDEIILVDDGSDDGAKFLDYLGCRVIHKAYGGPSSARNAALDVAQGVFVTFVDSDDEVVCDVYERVFQSLTATGADVCLFGVKTIWQDVGLSKVDVVKSESYGELAPARVEELSRKCLMNYVWNKVYRRSVLERNHLRFAVNGVPCEDIVFNLQVAMTRCSWCAVDYVGYHYFRTDGTLLSCYKETMIQGLALCRDAWTQYRSLYGGASDILGHLGNISAREMVRHEWNNIWTKGSPWGLCDRWRYLIDNEKFFKRPLFLVFLRKAIFALLRKYLYVRPIRRWHVRRIYPNAMKIWE